MKIKELDESYGRNSLTNYYDSDGNDLRGGASDEANLWYKYDPQDGRLKQRMIAGHEERAARNAGFRDGQEAALKVHGIVKSKYHHGKWIQNQGGKWVEVHPFGKPADVTEMDKSQKGAPGWNISDDEPGGKEHYVKPVKSKGVKKDALTSLNKEMNKAHKKTVKETASAGATSAANIGTVDAPHLSPGKSRGKKSYTGSFGTGSGTKSPAQPKVVQPKNSDGTAKNGLDVKASLFGQAKESVVIKRR